MLPDKAVLTCLRGSVTKVDLGRQGQKLLQICTAGWWWHGLLKRELEAKSALFCLWSVVMPQANDFLLSISCYSNILPGYAYFGELILCTMS